MEADATTFAPICIIDNFYKRINNKRPPARDTFVDTSGRDDKNVVVLLPVKKREAQRSAVGMPRSFNKLSAFLPSATFLQCAGAQTTRLSQTPEAAGTAAHT